MYMEFSYATSTYTKYLHYQQNIPELCMNYITAYNELTYIDTSLPKVQILLEDLILVFHSLYL